LQSEEKENKMKYLMIVVLLMSCGYVNAEKVDDRIWYAITMVESNKNPKAYNKGSGATGISQIK
jgi:hypothetical protein